MARFLAAGVFIDSDRPQVIAFAKQTIEGAADPRAAILRLYSTVRDTIIYDPYVNFADPANYRASGVLAAGRGFCIGKSALLAASARVIGVPARVGYADVRNHLRRPGFMKKSKPIFFVGIHTPSFICRDAGSKRRRLSIARCATGSAQAARIRRRNRFAIPAIRSGRPAAHGISEGSRHICGCAVRDDQADLPTTYPSLMSGDGLAGDFRPEAVAQSMDQSRP